MFQFSKPMTHLNKNAETHPFTKVSQLEIVSFAQKFKTFGHHIYGPTEFNNLSIFDVKS